MVEVSALSRTRGLIAVLSILLLLPACGLRSTLDVEGAGSEGTAGTGDVDGAVGGSGGGPGDSDASFDAGANCGNQVIEVEFGEQCDGTNLGGATCNSLGEGPGKLACDERCLFDLSMCETPTPGPGDGGPVGDGGEFPIGDGGPIL